MSAFGWRKKLGGDQLSDLKARCDPAPSVLSLESQALFSLLRLRRTEGETDSCLLAIPLSTV